MQKIDANKPKHFAYLQAGEKSFRKGPKMKSLRANVHEHAQTLHTSITAEDIESLWVEAMKWQCETPTAQPCIKRFDGASVWRAQKQQAEPEWIYGPDSLLIVMQQTRREHNKGKSHLHGQEI